MRAENNGADILILQHVIGKDTSEFEKPRVSVGILPEFGEILITDVEAQRTFLILCEFIESTNLSS
jgi:hypothetical protein